MSRIYKNIEEYESEARNAVTETEYHGLLNVDWKGMGNYPFVMKYKFDENGYTLMVSTLAAVFGEKLDLDAIQKRFKERNRFVEMLPKVMLKHLEQSVEIITGHEKPGINIGLDPFHVGIEHQFNVKGVTFEYYYQMSRLPFCEFRAHILKPILLRALILDEEKAVLQRKVEELEEKHVSSTSNGCGRRNFKEVYSAVDACVVQEADFPESALLKAFKYLQKNKTILPKSLESTPNVSPTKGVNSSSTNASLCNRLKDSKNETANIPYNEDDSVVSLESQNTNQESEEPEISCNIEKAEDGGVSNLADNLSANAQNLLDADKPIYPKKEIVKESNLMDGNKPVSPKREMPQEESMQNLMDVNKPVSPKRKMMEEESKEENTSMPSPDLKPSLAKKKKLFNF